MQESYESVISLAEEIAISWPRITAFAESHRRRGLVSDDGLLSENEEEDPPSGELEKVDAEGTPAGKPKGTSPTGGEGTKPGDGPQKPENQPRKPSGKRQGKSGHRGFKKFPPRSLLGHGRCHDCGKALAFGSAFNKRRRGTDDPINAPNAGNVFGSAQPSSPINAGTPAINPTSAPTAAKPLALVQRSSSINGCTPALVLARRLANAASAGRVSRPVPVW
ncbi:uncharacterized protein M6G45_016275 [Spheniscus humboldti]